MNYRLQGGGRPRPFRGIKAFLAVGIAATVVILLLFHFAGKAEKNLPARGEIRIEAENVGERR